MTKKQSSKPSTVLLVEDLEDIRNHWVAVLQAAGLEVIAPARFADVESQITRCDAVVLDYKLDEGWPRCATDGGQLARKWRAKFGYATPPVILLTQNSFKPEVDALQSELGIDCIEKLGGTHTQEHIRRVLRRSYIHQAFRHRFPLNKSNEIDIVAKEFVVPLGMWSPGEPGGFLLILDGPPGTGKTTVAGAIAGLLSEIGIVAESNILSEGDILDQWMGVPQRNLEALRADSETRYKAGIIRIHILNDVESILRKRDTSSHEVFASLTNVMNGLLDRADLDKAYPYVMVLTTNFAERLDDASKRRARCTRALHISPPSQADVAAWLAKNMMPSNWRDVARGLTKFEDAVTRVAQACCESGFPLSALYRVVIPKTERWSGEGRATAFSVSEILEAIAESSADGVREKTDRSFVGSASALPSALGAEKPPERPEEFRALADKSLRCEGGAVLALGLNADSNVSEEKKKSRSDGLVRPWGDLLTPHECSLVWHCGEQKARQFLWALAQAKGYVRENVDSADAEARFPATKLARALAPNGKVEDNARRLRYLFVGKA